MKNTIFFFMAFMLCVSTQFSCDNVEDPQDCNEWCDMIDETDNIEGTFFSNHGDCMSLCATCANPSESDGKIAVCICNYYEGFLNASGADWDAIGVKNKGQCIKLIKEALEDGEIQIGILN